MKIPFGIFCIFFLFATSLFGEIVKFSADVIEDGKDSSSKILAKFSIPQGYHIYGQNAEVGMPTKIEISAPKGVIIGSIKWQKEKEFEQDGAKYTGFDGDISAILTVLANKNIAANTPQKITLNASWLACSNDTCVPESASVDLFVKPAKIDESSSGIVAIIFSAFLGGLILNLMPCVFPVIGIKILSFASSASGSKKTAILNAIFYTLGIVLSFVALAILLLALRATGESLGWGFQLQNPNFAAAMAMLFFAMALSFVGVFEIGTSFAGAGLNSISQNAKNKYAESFLSGVLAVLVASPCTAPFMGGAVGAALSAEISYGMSMTIFASLGLGMAAPYVLLSALPKLSKFLPKAGMWLETFKKILSIPLFATVVWLAWLYTKQTGDLYRIIIALSILALGLWIYGKFSLPHKQKITRRLSILALISLTIFSFYVATSTKDAPQSTSSHSSWSATKVEELRRSGHPVYVDFTATWCLTCQYNKVVLHSEKIKKLFENRGIILLVGDWTNRDESIAKELEKFGRAGVPLNLLYPTQGDPIILPAILTESALIEAVDKIK